MKKGPELIQDIMLDIDLLDPNDGETLSPAVTDLKIKFAILQTLNDITTQLYEISHYGIGTD